MHKPILIVDGVGYDFFEFVDSKKGYFVPASDNPNKGQVFKYGAKVDGSIFKRGIHSVLEILDDTGQHPVTAKADGNDRVTYSAPELTVDGKTMHISVGTGAALRQLPSGELNLRLNVVHGGLGNLSGSNTKATPKRVEIPAAAVA